MVPETVVVTFWARIYVGLREGYNGLFHDRAEVQDACQSFCDKVGLCVTVEDILFIYTGGRECGVVVGLINYPGSPEEPMEVKSMALGLAEKLRVTCGQNRVSVVFPDETVMLGEV